MLNVQVQLGGILPSLPRVSKQNTYILSTVTGSWLVFLRLYGLEEEKRLVIGGFFFSVGEETGALLLYQCLRSKICQVELRKEECKYFCLVRLSAQGER